MITWVYSLLSVIFVSLISLVSVLLFLIKKKNLSKFFSYLVSFSVGSLFGNAFIHLIPKAIEESGSQGYFPLSILIGIFFSFAVENFLQWRHCHVLTSKEHPHSFAYMNLFGDAVHNFIDGLIIGGSYLTNTTLGITTTLSIVFHEIPQEIGDFGVLIYGGFSKSRAFFYNLLTALTAIFGSIVALSLSFLIKDFSTFLVPFAAGTFIYIAGSDLIPEIRKDENDFLKSSVQLLFLIFGTIIMLLLDVIQ
jgi:zinc and cadmium transporter